MAGGRTGRAPARAPSPAAAPAALNQDLDWRVYTDQGMAEAAMTDFRRAKNVAYWSETKVCDAFYERTAFKVRLDAGMLLYKFNSYNSLTAQGSTDVSPWWSAYHRYDVGSSLVDRLKLAEMNSVGIKELGRLTSAIVTEWNTLQYVLVVRLTKPVYAWYGGFASMPRFARHLPPRPPVPYDTTSGLKLFTPEEKAKLVAACARADADAVPDGGFTNWERDYIIEHRWKPLFAAGVTDPNLPAKADLKTHAPAGVTAGSSPLPPLPPLPAPAPAARASLSSGPPRRDTTPRLPGGSRQFYIPQLEAGGRGQVELVHLRDLDDPRATDSIERWWSRGHNTPNKDSKGGDLAGDVRPPG